jgi:hypothetical protein
MASEGSQTSSRSGDAVTDPGLVAAAEDAEARWLALAVLFEAMSSP